MTIEELSSFNGKNGQPAYVAVAGTVYDVSTSPMWQNGLHADAHQAGVDLTRELKSAPHIAAVIERFPSVGQLEVAAAQKPAGNSKYFIAMAVLIAVILVFFALR